ncbi:beta-galactosidase [Neotamlana nanhaiensis]|uniref:beta-galactosidase n=1 Tax=Neotamlana nanhaiensis TaxID=1382798 RepID=UPI00069B6BA7|nr:beta-galactosidase [Tamlana nanhaiensis]
MKFFSNIIGVFVLLFSTTLFAQTIHINANIDEPEIVEGLLKMGDPGPKGKEITVNNKYMMLDGKPVLPVMGEIHFSRTNPKKWEELILKMKANGITIISTYVFWIYHEEEEGVFNWEGQNNLRHFIELCKKHNVWAYPRIGPWCHGEVRNGGLPDWILKKENMKVRSNDEKYMEYVDRWYNEISKQLNGLYYKDGGPIIGIQLENEYWRGKGGEYHIMALKEFALKYGMDLPMYTVTGWRNASVPENEVIPLWGGYPAAPWNTDLKKITNNESYVFNKPINDQSIGHKDESSKYTPNYSLYPYFTCELGVGNQISEHRRPIIDAIDGVSISTSSVASGSNLPGYYVFAGGLNPVGKFTTLEENKIESGYWNEYPDISYDFQAAIRETGEIAKAYKKLKPFHYFLSEFGEQLAPMTPIIPENNSHPDSLQYAFRVKDDSGFLFASNYYRGYEKSVKKDVQFNIQLKNESIKIPSEPITIEDKTLFIWPVNLQMNDVVLKYASAQLICNVYNKKTEDWYFFENDGIRPEFLIAKNNVTSVSLNGKPISRNNGNFLIKNASSGLGNPIIIKTINGKTQRIFVLSQVEKDNFWLFKHKNNDYAYLSSGNLTMNNQGGELNLFSTDASNDITALNGTLKASGKTKISKQNGFKTLTKINTEKSISFELDTIDLSSTAKWLKISPESYSAKKELYNKQFYKTITLNEPSEIKKALFYFYSEENGNIRINGKWLNQTIKTGTKNTLDLTGYLKLGKNDILINYPYTNQEKAFLGVLEVEFYTAKKLFFPTDSSWTTTEQYKIPAPWEGIPKTEKPDIVTKPKDVKELSFSPYRYELKLDTEAIKNYKNVFLRIDYWGNKIKCYSGDNLVADNFNNETTWSINLTDINVTPHKPLVFEITPYDSENPKFYFDKPQTFDKTGIKHIEINPEFHHVFEVR